MSFYVISKSGHAYKFCDEDGRAVFANSRIIQDGHRFASEQEANEVAKEIGGFVKEFSETGCEFSFGKKARRPR